LFEPNSPADALHADHFAAEIVDPGDVLTHDQQPRNPVDWARDAAELDAAKTVLRIVDCAGQTASTSRATSAATRSAPLRT
jgi:hypothetical protein